MLKAKLILIGGDAKSTEVILKLPTVIGRGREVTLTLSHPLVSRRHCEIYEKDGRLFVKDLDSLNGTYVNNHRIEGEQPLDPEQLLTLGNVTFRAVYVVRSPVFEAGAPASDTLVERLAAEKAKTIDNSDLPTRAVDLQDFAGTVADVETKPCEPPDQSAQQPPADSGQDTDRVPPPTEETDYPQPAAELDSQVLNQDPELPAKNKSISVSAIERLPHAPAPASFSGGLAVSGQTDPHQPTVDSVKIQLSEEQADQPADDSRLDSFVRKLPK